jgi:molecular chaperone GrpE
MSSKAKDWGKIKEEHEAEEALTEQASEELDMLDDEDEGEGAGGSGESTLDTPSYAALEEQLALAEKKAHDNWDKLMRVTADMDNLRRRSERDVSQAHRYGLEKFINHLLPVVDSLEQAEQLAEQHGDKAMHEGLELTMKLFLDMLEKANVEQLNPVGDAFNPEIHEAMTMQESADAKPNTVISVFQKGYKLNDRVIRAARVIVAK